MDSSTERPIADQIRTVLHDHNFWFEYSEHDPVRTSEEAAAIRPGYSQHQGAKALIISGKRPGEKKHLLMLVIPGDQRFTSNKVKSALGMHDVRFATEEEVQTCTGGVRPGGIPPFGNLFGIEVYIDRQVLANEIIIFNASRTVSIAMRSQDYATIVHPTIVELV